MPGDEAITFDGQRPNEEVLVMWRKHPWVLAHPGFISVGIILIAALVLRFFGASAVTSITIVVALIAIAVIGGLGWFKWRNGMYILTTERLIDVDQRSVFHRVVGELPIEHIQDVAYEVKGPLATMLNFGNVVVQTIGGGTTITMEVVESPHTVQQSILEARNTYVGANPNRKA